MQPVRGQGWKWISIVALFVLPLFAFYVLEHQLEPLRSGYQSAAADFRFADEGRQWRNYDPQEHNYARVTGTYRFQLTLPDNQWRDPYLYLLFVPNAEVYLEDRLIHAYKPRHEYWEHPHLIPLPDDFGGKTLTIHIDFHNQRLYPGLLTISSPLNLVAKVFLQSGYRIMLGFITLLAGIVGLALFARRRQASYLYFSLFALYVAQLCVARSWFLFGLLAETPVFPILQDALLALGGFLFIRFYEAMFGSGPYRIHRRLSRLMLAMFALLLVTSLFFPAFHEPYMSPVIQNVVAPFAMLSVLVSAVRMYWKQPGTETFWLMAGFVVVGVATLLYFLRPLVNLLDTMTPAWFNLSAVGRVLYGGDRFLHGIFILLFCMGMTLSERIRGIYLKAQSTAEQLAKLSGSLEQLVQERTKKLEQTNQNLRASMQETAEALAEMAVLEDRNRIAQDMHDRAGHSLTAALIQIEAAKMLATKDTRLALQKLDATRESVASGLDSIRETVRMMKLDYEERSLVPSLQKLIQETQKATGVHILYDPSPLPDLNTIMKKTVYLALQEGLTNGIRHGKATRFLFTLKKDGDALHFQLANDGIPYTGQEFGFGLNTMIERIGQLNGTLQLTATDHHACVLDIVLPIEPDGTERSEPS